MNTGGHTTIMNNSTAQSHLQTVKQNASMSDECQNVQLGEMDYLPWDNVDNIVNAEVETATKRIKDNMLVLLFLIGGPGNVINMAVFYKQGFKDRVNLCLFALSLADELYLIIAIVCHGEQVYLQFTTKESYGDAITFLLNHHINGLFGFLYVSQIMSAIIASERCYCVLRPLKVQSLMRNRTMLAVIIVMNVLVVGLYFVVTFRFQIGCVFNPQSGSTERTMVIGPLYQNHKQMVDYLDGFFFGAAVPGCAMTVTVSATIITTVKLYQIVNWRSETSSSISAREVAITKMLVGASILFVACLFPSAAVRVCWLVFPEMNAGGRQHNFYLTTVWIGELLNYINASFNIFVYYIMGSRFRQTLSSLLTKKVF